MQVNLNPEQTYALAELLGPAIANGSGVVLTAQGNGSLIVATDRETVEITRTGTILDD